MGTIDLDWRALRGVLIGLGFALSTTLSLAWGGFYFADTMAKEVKKIRQQTQAIKLKASNALKDQEMIKIHLPLYHRLRKQEIFGQDSQNRRLAWIEDAKTAAEQARLPAMRYNITQRKIYTPLLPVTKETMEVFASAMELDLGLLHEGDLLNYFELLRRQGRGFFTVENCRLNLANQGKAQDLQTPTVSAKCRILWQTIAKKPEDS